MRLARFGDYVFNGIGQEDLLDTADAPGRLLPLPGGGAYDAYGDDPSAPRTTTITVHVELLGDTLAGGLQAEVDAARALHRVRDKLWAVLPDGSWRWVWARCTRVRVLRTRVSMAYQAVDLEFELAQPDWNGRYMGVWQLNAGYQINTGLVLNAERYALLAYPTVNTISLSNGNRPVSHVRLTVDVEDPETTDLMYLFWIHFLVYDADGLRQHLAYENPILRGGQLVIDSGAQSVRSDLVAAGTLVDDSAHFSLVAPHTADEWFTIWQDATRLDVWASTNKPLAGTLRIDYYEGWK